MSPLQHDSGPPSDPLATLESLARFPDENPYPVLRIANDGRLLYANRPSHVLLDAWRARVGDIIASSDLRSVIDRAIESKSHVEWGVAVGATTFAIVVAPILEESYLNFYGRDVSGQLRAEEATLNLARFPDENPHPVLRVTPAGVITYANLASRQLLDEWRVEVGGVLPDFLCSALLDAMQSGKHREVDVTSAEDTIALVIAPITESTYANLYGYNVTRRDRALAAARSEAAEAGRQEVLVRADLRMAQARLVQSEKMASLGRLVAGIAHEFNTPVGAMGSMVQTLKSATGRLRGLLNLEGMSSTDGKQLSRLLEIIEASNQVIHDGAENVAKTVRRLRSFARLDEAEFQQTDVNASVGDVVALLGHELAGIDVQVMPGTLPSIRCYSSQLNQVLLNILLNACEAVKATPDPSITISTRHVDRHIEVAIRDNGCGIPEVDPYRVFDPGYTTKGVGVGTGLGLAICYGIVKDHGGEILIETEVGKGTTFTIRIHDDLAPRKRS